MRISIMGLCAVVLLLGPLCSVGAAGKCEDVMNKFKKDGFSGLDEKESITMMECKFAEWNAKRDKLEAEAAEAKKCESRENLISILLDDLKFRTEVGYADTVEIRQNKDDDDGDDDDGDDDDESTLKLDEEAYRVAVGYFNRPASGLLLPLVNKGLGGRWEEKVCPFIDDELKFDLSFGFGRTVQDPKGPDNLKTSNKTFFNVGLRYSVPLEQLLPFFGINTSPRLQ